MGSLGTWLISTGLCLVASERTEPEHKDTLTLVTSDDLHLDCKKNDSKVTLREDPLYRTGTVMVHVAVMPLCYN